MALLNVSDFARHAGVSRQSIDRAIKAERLVRRKDGYLDTKNKDNIEFVALHNNGKPKQPKPGQFALPKRKKVVKKKKPARRGRPPKPKRKPKDIPYISPFVDDNLPESQTGNGQGELKLNRNDLEKKKLLVTIEKTLITTAKERQKLIDRDLVKGVLGLLSTVDHNELLPIAANIASEVAGICGKDDNKTVTQIIKLIEEKLYGFLKHRQRITQEFLKKVKAEQVELKPSN